MARCVTCGAELHPERAEKYNYCTKRECRERNAKPLTIAAVAVNKSADQYLVLNERTREELAAGNYQDRRKSSSVTDGPPPERGQASSTTTGSATNAGARPTPRPVRRTPASPPPRRSWTRAQEDLALIYNAQGMRPDEVAERLGVSRHTATQMILAAKTRARG